MSSFTEHQPLRLWPSQIKPSGIPTLKLERKRTAADGGGTSQQVSECLAVTRRDPKKHMMIPEADSSGNYPFHTPLSYQDLKEARCFNFSFHFKDKNWVSSKSC